MSVSRNGTSADNSPIETFTPIIFIARNEIKKPVVGSISSTGFLGVFLLSQKRYSVPTNTALSNEKLWSF